MVIGISYNNQVSVGKVIGPSGNRPPTPNLEQFKKFIAKAGFNWNGYVADHVVDLSFGGLDEVRNLWPEKEKNPAPNQGIDLESGKQVGISGWNEKKSGGKKPHEVPGKYFRIFGVKKP